MTEWFLQKIYLGFFFFAYIHTLVLNLQMFWKNKEEMALNDCLVQVIGLVFLKDKFKVQR